MQAGQVVGRLFSCIHQCDLQALQGFWNLLSEKLFSRLASSLKDTIYRLETSLLRLFLVNAKSLGRNDVIQAFFSKNSQSLLKRKEWKEWLGESYAGYSMCCKEQGFNNGGLTLLIVLLFNNMMIL